MTIRLLPPVKRPVRVRRLPPLTSIHPDRW
jgi:hypothetical protein